MFAELGMRKSFCFALVVFVCISASSSDWYSIAALRHYYSGSMAVKTRMVIVVTIMMPYFPDVKDVVESPERIVGRPHYEIHQVHTQYAV